MLTYRKPASLTLKSCRVPCQGQRGTTPSLTGKAFSRAQESATPCLLTPSAQFWAEGTNSNQSLNLYLYAMSCTAKTDLERLVFLLTPFTKECIADVLSIKINTSLPVRCLPLEIIIITTAAASHWAIGLPFSNWWGGKPTKVKNSCSNLKYSPYLSEVAGSRSRNPPEGQESA